MVLFQSWNEQCQLFDPHDHRIHEPDFVLFIQYKAFSMRHDKQNVSFLRPKPGFSLNKLLGN